MKAKDEGRGMKDEARIQKAFLMSAFHRTEARIIQMEIALGNMRSKQIARARELTRLLALEAA